MGKPLESRSITLRVLWGRRIGEGLCHVTLKRAFGTFGTIVVVGTIVWVGTALFSLLFLLGWSRVVECPRAGDAISLAWSRRGSILPTLWSFCYLFTPTRIGQTIIPCISCNQYCIGRMGLNLSLGCIQTPATGNELQLPRLVQLRNMKQLPNGDPPGST